MRIVRIPTKITTKVTKICNFNDWGYMVSNGTGHILHIYYILYSLAHN